MSTLRPRRSRVRDAMHDHNPSTQTTNRKELCPAHCWESGPPSHDGCSTTCMLPDGHERHGLPHEWTRDDQIRITFL